MALQRTEKNELEIAVVLKRKIRGQNCSEASEILKTLKSLAYSTDHQVLFEVIQGLNSLCITFPKLFSQVQLFKDLEPIFQTTLSSESPQLRSESFKFLSILFNKSLSSNYLDLFDYYEEYLLYHVDEVAMAYIFEMLLGIFNYLSKERYMKILDQAGGILEKSIENDLISYTLQFIKKGVDIMPNEDHYKKAIENRLGFGIITRLSDGQYFEDSLYLIRKIMNFESMGQVFKDALTVIISFLGHHQTPVRHTFSQILRKQSELGWEYLENMINKNFIPVLVNHLTGNDLILKVDMIYIVSRFFYQQLQHQIMELLENNIVNILCRIIERDNGDTQMESLKAMENLLSCNNEIYKSFADSCRFSRLIGELGKKIEFNAGCIRILQRFYPRAPLPVCNLPIGGGNAGIWNQGNAGGNFNAINGVAVNNFVPNAGNLNTGGFSNLMNINAGNNLPVGVNNKAAGSNVAGTQGAGNKSNVTGKGKGKGLASKKHKKVKIPGQQTIQFKKIAVPGGKPAKMSASTKSGLVFPVARIFNKMKKSHSRVGKSAAVYLTGVVEYLCAEVLECAMTHAKSENRKIIKPVDIQQAVKQDDELDILMADVIFPDSGNVKTPLSDRDLVILNKKNH